MYSRNTHKRRLTFRAKYFCLRNESRSDEEGPLLEMLDIFCVIVQTRASVLLISKYRQAG